MKPTKTCPHSKVEIIKKNETYPVKGEPITIEAQVAVCQACGEEVFMPKYDDNNLRKAYDIYRKRHDLLGAEQIAMIRHKYQLSQRTFAVLLGCTQATINRYEKGAIPDSAYDSLIRLMEKPENVLVLLEQKRDELDVKDAQKLENILERLISEFHSGRNILSLLNDFQTNQVNIYSGFKKFDLSKMIAMVMYFSVHQKNLFKTKLMKLLWYSDMFFFKKYIQSISGMRYAHLPYGPVPEQHDLILSVLKTAGYIDLIPDVESERERIEAAIDYDFSCLSNDELELLEEINQRFIDVTSKEISDISHDELAYVETKMRELISYEYAEQLKELN